MMLLSGVWFSMEGTQPWLQQLAQLFPLTHMVGGARAVMLDGAGWVELAPQLLTLTAMTLAFLAIGARIARCHLGMSKVPGRKQRKTGK